MITISFKRKENLYQCFAIDDLISRYIEKDGEILEIEPESLGYGKLLLYPNGANLKTIIVTEIALNCWSSTHKVRMYNKMPKKYEKILEEIE